MKNIVVHEKLENGKTLLVAYDMPKVLFDNKGCQVIGKKYNEKKIYNKERLLNKFSRRVAIPLHKKIENDDFISYLFCGDDVQGTCIIILSKKEPFTDITFEPMPERLGIKDLKGLNLEIAKEFLEQSLKEAERKAHYDTRILETRSDRNIYCKWCSEWLEFNDFEDKQRIECKCGAVYEVALKRVTRAEIREV